MSTITITIEHQTEEQARSYGKTKIAETELLVDEISTQELATIGAAVTATAAKLVSSNQLSHEAPTVRSRGFDRFLAALTEKMEQDRAREIASQDNPSGPAREFDPGPEVDDEGGMSERRSLVDAADPIGPDVPDALRV